MVKCSVLNCTNEANVPGSARGWCRAHYKRWYNYGDEKVEAKRLRSWNGEICSVENCEKPVKVNGLCVNHYAVVRRRNNPEAQRLRNKAFKERFRAKQEALMGRPRPERCEMCDDVGYGRKPTIVFDHCHASGKPRGWLCDRCNKVLGLVKDSPELLIKMAEYLKYHNDSINYETEKIPTN